jgi:protein phosphatase
MAQQTEIALGVGARSEKGRREDNQDKMTAFSTALGTFYIVADGMGGHRGGAEASHSVLEGYRKHLRAFPEAADFADVVQHATTLTNAEIFAAGRSGDPSVHGMGSTVVMAMLRTVPGGAAGTGTSGMELLTAHIGDSRAYLLRGATLTRLTRDHSAVQRMVDENLISAEAAKTHPDLNVLTRALGKQAEIAIEVGARVPLYPGDTVLLCTDGLWGHVSDEQMAYELSADRSASETADALVQMALDNGSDDNVTLQILRLEDRNAPGRPMAAPPEAAAAVPEASPPANPAPTVLEAQRGRGGTQGFTAPVAAPAVRVEVSGPPMRKRGHLVAYLLLVAAFVVLAAGGSHFWNEYLKTRPGKTQIVPGVEQNCGGTPRSASKGDAKNPCPADLEPPPPTPKPKKPESARPSSPPAVQPPAPIERRAPEQKQNPAKDSGQLPAKDPSKESAKDPGKDADKQAPSEIQQPL